MGSSESLLLDPHSHKVYDPTLSRISGGKVYTIQRKNTISTPKYVEWFYYDDTTCYTITLLHDHKSGQKQLYLNNQVIAYQQYKLIEKKNTILFTLYINKKRIDVYIESNAQHTYQYYMKIDHLMIQEYHRQYWGSTVYYSIDSHHILVHPKKDLNDEMCIIVDTQAVECIPSFTEYDNVIAYKFQIHGDNHLQCEFRQHKPSPSLNSLRKNKLKELTYSLNHRAEGVNTSVDTCYTYEMRVNDIIVPATSPPLHLSIIPVANASQVMVATDMMGIHSTSQLIPSEKAVFTERRNSCCAVEMNDTMESLRVYGNNHEEYVH